MFFARAVIWIIAAFYLYGAGVHVANMLSLTGFDWPQAPLKWRMLDVIYLCLDVAVMLGLGLRARFGVIAFFAAATSQIMLYTVLRPWVLDVPDTYLRSADDLAYLDALVLFHVVTCALMVAALLAQRHSDFANR